MNNEINMRKILILMAFAIASISAYAKPHCQSFNNYDGKVTIIFADESVDKTYNVSDVKLIPSRNGKEYNATSVSVSVLGRGHSV